MPSWSRQRGRGVRHEPKTAATARHLVERVLREGPPGLLGEEAEVTGRPRGGPLVAVRAQPGRLEHQRPGMPLTVVPNIRTRRP